jgi:O-antigen/teichoic acid export membrane protein
MVYARKFLANYTILIIGDLGSRFIGFWALVHIARVVGTDLFGMLSFATAFTAYFALIVRQGLDTYGIQQVARNPGLVRQYAETILGLRLTAGLAAFAALVVTVWVLPQPDLVKILILLNGLAFFTVAASTQWVFQAREEMRYFAAASIISQSVFAVCVLTLLRRPEQLFYAPLFQLCGELMAVAYLFLPYCRRYGPLWPAFDMRVWGEVLRDSIPMGLSAAFGVVMFNFDMLMLGFWKPAADVGEYSAAYKFINFFSAFVQLFGVNVLPLIARFKGNAPGLRRASDKVLQHILLLTIPLAAGGAVLAKPLMDFVFGDQFLGGAGALRILIWITPLVSIRVMFRNVLLSHGFQRNLLWCTCRAALLNAALNLLLIPGYSYLGSSVATLISEFLLLWLLSQNVARTVQHLPILRHAWKPLLACVPMVLCTLWYRSGGVFLRTFAGGSVFLLSAWLIRAFSIREIRDTFLPGAGAPAVANEGEGPAPKEGR